jgi:putative FmdB family regulatory protein
MPFYEFECDKCGYCDTFRVSIGDRDGFLSGCKSCDGVMRRRLNAPDFRMQGATRPGKGWRRKAKGK